MSESGKNTGDKKFSVGHFLHLTRVYFVSSKELVPQGSDNYEV